jgi:hypothetical protein
MPDFDKLFKLDIFPEKTNKTSLEDHEETNGLTEEMDLLKLPINGDLFTEAKELSSGIFWVITDNRDISDYKVIFFDIPCDIDGTPTGTHTIALNSKNELTYNHKKIWETEIKINSNHRPYNKKDYDYYPRGRVRIANNRADIYLNPNINKSNIIDEIKRSFGLSSHNISNVRIMNDNSTHYQCWIDRKDT